MLGMRPSQMSSWLLQTLHSGTAVFLDSVLLILLHIPSSSYSDESQRNVCHFIFPNSDNVIEQKEKKTQSIADCCNRLRDAVLF